MAFKRLIGLSAHVVNRSPNRRRVRTVYLGAQCLRDRCLSDVRERCSSGNRQQMSPTAFTGLSAT